MSQLIQQKVTATESNSISGNYRPMFFDLEEFKVSRADLNSIFYNSEEEDDDPEHALLNSSFSFAYLREDKLRTIDVYDLNNKYKYTPIFWTIIIPLQKKKFKVSNLLVQVWTKHPLWIKEL